MGHIKKGFFLFLDIYSIMKKVVRLTESELIRLVKTIIKEQSSPKQDWHWVGTLRDTLKPYGIVYEPNFSRDGNTALMKGNDYDGISIFVNHRTGDVGVDVVTGGQSKVSKKYKINQQDYNNIGVQGEKVKNMIMKL